jgi:multicomponent Na+:H+ antiporter subunit E
MRLWYAVRYALWLIGEILKGTFMIARDVLTPGRRSTPQILEYPLRCETDLEITLMASSITITPGTLTLGIASAGAEGRPTLFVHAMYADELASELGEMQRRLLLATRGREKDS